MKLATKVILAVTLSLAVRCAAQELCSSPVRVIQLSATQFQLHCTSLLHGWKLPPQGSAISGTLLPLPAGWRDDPAKLIAEGEKIAECRAQNRNCSELSPLTLKFSFNPNDCGVKGEPDRFTLYACSERPVTLGQQEALINVFAGDGKASASVSSDAKQVTLMPAARARLSNHLFIVNSPPVLNLQPGEVEVQEIVEGEVTKTHRALASLSPTDDPDSRGRLEIALFPGDRIRSEQATIRVVGLKDGSHQTVPPLEVQATFGTPAKTPEDAEYYVKLHHVATKGGKPSYGLEGKLAPKNFYFSPTWRFTPSASADIAVRDANSADTIDFAGDFVKAKIRPSGRTFLAYEMAMGAEFETDREFDRGNLLGHLTYTPQFKFTEMSKEKRTKMGLCGDLKCRSGYGLGFQAVAELGGSTIVQTTSNKAKTQSLSVPRFEIARLFPKVTGFLEYSQLTLRIEVQPRYLLTSEKMTQELASGSLVIRSISGFRSYQVGTAEYAFDRDKHVSFSVAYKNGSAPPTYQNVNKVESGLIFLF